MMDSFTQLEFLIDLLPSADSTQVATIANQLKEELAQLKQHHATPSDTTQETRWLQQTELFANDLLGSISDGFTVLNEHWEFTYANQQIARSLRTNVEDLIGKNVWAIFPGFANGPFQRTCEQVMQERTMQVIISHYEPWNTWFQNRIFPTGKGISIFSTDLTHQKRLEISLKKSEASLKTLIENLPYIIFALDVQGNLVKYNTAFEQFGYYFTNQKPEMGQHLASYVQSLPSVWLDALQEALQGASALFEMPIADKVYEVHFNPSYDAETQVGVAGFMADITSRKQTEKTLQESEQRYKSLFEHNSDGVFSVDMHGNFTSHNQALLQIIEEPLQGKLFQDIALMVSPKDKATLLNAYVAVKQGVSGTFEIDITTPKGHQKRIHSTNFPIIINGTIEGVYGVVKDITEKKKNDQNLLLFKHVMDNMFDLVSISLPTGEQIYQNKAFGIVTGLTPEQSWRAPRFFAPFVDRTLASTIHKQIVQGEYWKRDVQLYNQHLDAVDYHLSAGPIIDDSNEVIALFGIFTDISERKKYERELEQYNRRITTILESITEGFFAVDHNYTVTYMNAEAERLLGMSRHFMLNENLWDKFGYGAPLNFYAEYAHAIKENVSVSFDDYYEPAHRWFHVNAYPSENSLSIFFRDVTEQKLIEELERIEKETLEYNTRPDSTLSQVLQFYLNKVEPLIQNCVCSVWQLAEDKLEPIACQNLSPVLSDLVQQKYALAHRNFDLLEKTYFTDKQIEEDIYASSFWKNDAALLKKHYIKSFWSYPIKGSTNKHIGVFALFFNSVRTPSKEEENSIENIKRVISLIFENKLAEQTIRESNNRYDLVAKATNDVIWDFNLDTGKIEWNEAVYHTFGYEDALQGSNYAWWCEKVHPDDLERVKQSLREHLQEKKTHWEDEYRFVCKNGELKYVYDRGFTIYDENLRPIRMIGAMQDVSVIKQTELKLNELNTELERRAQELVTSNEELEKFAYVASHDLQEPLRMVSSFLQLLKKKYESQLDEQALKYIGFAVNGAERMKQLIMDLLEYSRVGTNKDAFAEVDLNEVLAEILHIFDDKIKKADGLVHTMPLPKVLGNRIQLSQLLQNLVGNALKYRKAQAPEVYISVEAQDNQWVFAIKDNGIGIDPAYYQRIFIIFQRLHSKTEYSGTGIGLAICKKIIERHKGQIWVESQPNEGSTFYFSLPMME